MKVKILSVEGIGAGETELPGMFSCQYKPWLVNRAIVAESTQKLQPQGHYVLAGMQTTAVYVGKMHAWRSGRHVGRAIRPREKLAEGAQGKVRRIPSAVTGKRAIPHLIEKRITEKMNKTEYISAIHCAISKTFNNMREPAVLSNDIESIRKTGKVSALLKDLHIANLERQKVLKSKSSRPSSRKRYRHSVTIVVKDDKGIVKAARNIPGVNVCTVDEITVGRLMPGGTTKSISIWSENAVNESSSIEEKIRARR